MESSILFNLQFQPAVSTCSFNLQLQPELVHSTFKQVYYLENVLLFAGSIWKDSIQPEQLYNTFANSDNLGKVQIQTSLQ
ncbi:hypothetical protein [Sporisorium scitamineum]|uniref:Uncharacterized protein n=1 Tax=Sporisorium scitamineum TaxID=49012 RepID=A0A0F7SDG6_9BASI|nr:hypothetical protein [Sporisorium scitamineum]